MRTTLPVVAAFLALTCSGLLPEAAAKMNFKPERLHWVDTIQRPDGRQNYLFRGNLPLTEKVMDWTALTERIEEIAAEEAGVALPPESYYMIDLSFLNPFEYTDEKVEKAYWDEHPDKGEWRNWILTGTLVNPTKLSEKKQKALAKKYPAWSLERLPKRIDALQAALPVETDGSGADRPVVFYGHCEAGVDRTGEFMASYRMAVQGWNWKEAMEEADAVTGRPIRKASRWAAAWYCLYLKHGPAQKEYLDCTGGGLDDDEFDDAEYDEFEFEFELGFDDAELDMDLSEIAALNAADSQGLVEAGREDGRLKRSDPFDPERVHFVDYNEETNAWLFRSNMPMDADGNFLYEELMDRIAEVAGEEGPEGVAPPSELSYVVDLTFISPVEFVDLRREQKFWARHPDLGEMKWWMLTGTPSNPWKVKDEDKRAEKAADMPEWNKEKLVPRLERLKDMMATPREDGRPVVFLGHCEHGTDRTGEFFAAYSMRYLGWDWAPALEYANNVNKERPMMRITRNSAAWYCLYLQHGLGMDVDCTPPEEEALALALA